MRVNKHLHAFIFSIFYSVFILEEVMSPISHIHIAYGSESGNAEKIAQQLAQQDFLSTYSLTLATLNETI